MWAATKGPAVGHEEGIVAIRESDRIFGTLHTAGQLPKADSDRRMRDSNWRGVASNTFSNKVGRCSRLVTAVRDLHGCDVRGGR